MTFSLTDQRIKDEVLIQVNLLYSNEEAVTPAIVKLELDSRQVAFNEAVTTLTTEGTQNTYKKDETEDFIVEITNQVIQTALHKVALTPSETALKYLYTGKVNTRLYGLELIFEGTDIDDGSLVTTTYTFHKMSVKKYTPKNGATRKTIGEQQIQFTAIKTKKDLLGAFIEGDDDTAEGNYYTLAQE